MSLGREKPTIASLREKYQSGETTPSQVMEQIVQQARDDAAMNIWITPPSMDAIRPYLDGLAQKDPALPLWGIPFAVKDNIDVQGTPTSAACEAFAYTPQVHASVVERLVAAGAIPVGKTNLDQFATGLVGTRSPYGETHNALRPELISGGSSAGSAVSVARGQVAFALGTDTAGSGRVPAALHRLVGFKPSLGAWPTTGVVPACASLDCVTVFAHTLSDALAVDDVVRGLDDRDPWSKSIPRPSAKLPGKLLLPKETPAFFGPFRAEYSAAWEASVATIQQLHIPIEHIETTLFEQAAAILYEGPWVAERWADLGSFVTTHPGATFPVTEQVLQSALSPDYSAASVFQAIHRLQAFKLEVRALLADAVLVMPTAGGTWTREQVRERPVQTNRDMGRYTNHCNLLDLCAVAIPTVDAAPNLPFGVTIFGLAQHEDFIIGTARQYGDRNSMAVTSTDEDHPGPDMTPIAVCGLHMRGFSLEQQMLAHGARFVREALTMPKYRLYQLPTTPAKPGLVKQLVGGTAIQLEIWEMPLQELGRFANAIPAPLGLGKIELQSGEEVIGFLSEPYAVADATDITAFRGWREFAKQSMA